MKHPKDQVVLFMRAAFCKILSQEVRKNIFSNLIREISIQGEGDGTACAVVNQLWASLFTNNKQYFSMRQHLILQLVDDCASGKVTFSLYRDFPDLINKC